jgi:lactate dehydrogenase-like 2-hydroxyacid dehydrogenase
MKPRIVIAPVVPDAVAARARVEFDAVMPDGATMSRAQMLQALAAHRAEGLYMTSGIRLDAGTIAALPDSVRVAGTSSVGFDHIDVAAAKARGLVVTNTPEVVTDCTADLTFMLMLAACRRAHEFDALMRAGWRRPIGNADFGTKLSGKTLGIVGLGRIGRAVARRARGFDMTVLYTDLARLPEAQEAGATYVPALHDLLARSQIVTLHAPGGKATDRLMDEAAFARMPAGAVFVNAARGTLVDEEALIGALRSGHLAAAGLDVFRREPDFDTRIAEFPNVFLSPHMGTATRETRAAMGMRTLDNILAVCSGRAAIDPLWS